MSGKHVIPNKSLASGFSMPTFGFGTWRVGGAMEADTSHDMDDVEAIRRAIAAGVTHIDTAELYGNGHAEELVAQATGNVPRGELFLVSKVMAHHLHYDDLLQAAERSLKRLETDYLDLYLIHHPNPSISMEETFRALDQLVSEGKIKYIGVSNFTKERLAEAQSITANKIVVNQVHYSLVCRAPEVTGLLAYCQQNDVLLEAWRPVGGGVLAQVDASIMQELMRKYGKTSSQIAINWLISQSNVITLSKMTKREHLDENLAALTWHMESNDIERLRREFPGQIQVSNAVPLG